MSVATPAMRVLVAALLCLALGHASARILPKKRDLQEDFPDVGLTPPQMIERQGYPAETHWVTTSDGYILQMHRIPNPGRPVILVQHGSLSSSADWLLMGEGKCIPYMLWDRGYDVWLGNARGNTWSRNHTWMNPDTNLDFWDFTFHEMGVYDLPAVIDYMLAQTGVQKIDYIGHSMGTSMFYVLCSELPEYNARIRQMHSYAPVAFMELTRSPLLLYIAPWVWVWDWISLMMGQGEYMPSDDLNNAVADATCSDESYLQDACAMQIFMLCGYSPNQLNYTTLPLIQVYSPAGTSTKNILHFTKEILSLFQCVMAPLRPTALLLLLVALGVLAVPCCCGSRSLRRDTRDDSVSMLVGPENAIVRPSRPKVFTSPEELRGYLEALSNYYAIAGRPRFGKRAPALTQSMYDISNFRHLPSDVYELLDPPQMMDD